MAESIAIPAAPPTFPASRASSSTCDSCSPPSSPLSTFSKTPSPPSSPSLPTIDPSKRYPSPCATSQSGGASPRKLERDADADGPPPTKRRRLQPPPKRPRMTRYLDLGDMAGSEACELELAYLLQALRTKKKIVVIAGAGISVSAGSLFTTLRSQHGLRGSGKHLFDASVYKHDSSTSSFHSMVRELAHMTQTAKPTPFHHMLASIAHEGRLMRLYSQNVDCIDTNMTPLATKVPLNIKGPWPATIQLHGGLAKMVCSKCGQLEDFDGSLFEGPEPPPCSQCTVIDELRTTMAGKRSHGIGRLRPRIVLYNEYNPDEEAIGNVSKADLRRSADAVIVAGTSLKIPGVRRLVKELCHTTRSRRDGFTAWINVDAEPQGAEFKDCWDLVVRGKCDDVARLTALPRWDESDVGSPSNWQVEGEEGLPLPKLEIVLDDYAPSPPKLAASRKSLSDAVQTKCSHPTAPLPTTSMPTPVSSPKPPRKRLPTARQSTLPFKQIKKEDTAPHCLSKVPGSNGKAKDSTKPGSCAATGAVAIGHEAPRAQKTARQALPRQKPRAAPAPPKGVARSKTEPMAATNRSITQTFRTSKPTPVATSDGKKRRPLPLGRMVRQKGSDSLDGRGSDHGGHGGFSGNNCDSSVPIAVDISGISELSELSDLSELSSPPDSLERRSSADVVKLPSLRGHDSSPLAGKANTLGRTPDVKVWRPSSLSPEHIPKHLEHTGHAAQTEAQEPQASDNQHRSDDSTTSARSIPRGMGDIID